MEKKKLLISFTCHMEELHLGVISVQAIELPTGALPLPLPNYGQHALCKHQGGMENSC